MKSYKQVPKIKGNFCPVCNIECNDLRSTKVVFYNFKTNQNISKYIDLFICPHCNVRFANEEIFKTYFSKRNDFRPIFFVPNNNANAVELFKKIRSFPFGYVKSLKKAEATDIGSIANNKEVCNRKNLRLKCGKLFSIREVNMKASIKDISIAYVDKTCIVCNGEVYPYVSTIPVNDTHVVKIAGKYCRECERFFYHDLKLIKKILDDNDYATNYRINTDWYIDPVLKQQHTDLTSDGYSFYLKEEKTGIINKVIIISNKEKVDDSLNIYHYTSVVARNLLSDILYFGKRIISLNGKNYHVILSENTNSIIENNYILQKINIRKNGGYEYGPSNDEIVDVLLYSPFTKRYEISKVSYDAEEDYYYMDISKLKSFIEEYGNPGILIKVYSDTKKDEFDWLKKESILYELGYTTSKKDNLSDGKRQGIIAFVLDNGLMTSKEVINLLEFNIKTHQNNNVSKIKWKEDIEFTENYKVNPDRFIIAKI